MCCAMIWQSCLPFWKITPGSRFLLPAVYAQLLPQCERAYVTKIYQTYPADTAFPNLDENPDWELEEKGEMQEEKGVRFSFDVYKKR